nr:MAG TPA: hypothetical protein [Caudoviricetes sp.]
MTTNYLYKYKNRYIRYIHIPPNTPIYNNTSRDKRVL